MRRSAAIRVTKSLVYLLLLFSVQVVSQTIEPLIAAPKIESNSTSSATAARILHDKLRIGAGDLLEVSVYGVSDFKHETRVSDSGEIVLPLVGTISIGGLTVEDAQTTVANVLVNGGFFRDPQVMVLIKDYASHGISVMGEVSRPGVYPTVSTRRLFDIVALAGGFTAKSGRLVTITHRDTPDKPANVQVTNDPAKSMASNVEVYPGDTIVVSKAGIVYVVGDVGRPGGFVMENGEKMTVLQAIAMAQGVNRTAAVGSARLIRRASGKPKEIKLPLKKILGAKADDVDLMAEDILFIPGSLAKNAVRRGVDSAIHIATSVAIYGLN